jgi:hypothetical protein
MPTNITSPLLILGTGGGASPGGAGNISFMPVDGIPTLVALRGSQAVDTKTGVLYLNTSAGVTGTTWTALGPPNGATTPLFTAIASSAVIANTAARTVYSQSYTLAGDSLAVGDVLQFVASGTTASVTETYIWDISFGGVALASSQAAVAVGQGWSLVGEITVRAIGVGGVASLASGFTGGPNERTKGATAVTTTGVDTTVANVLGIAVTMDTASAATTTSLQTLAIRKVSAP